MQGVGRAPGVLTTLLATVAAAAALAAAFSAVVCAATADSATTPSCACSSASCASTSSPPWRSVAIAVVVASSAARRVSTRALACSLASSRAFRSNSSLRRARKSTGSTEYFLPFFTDGAFSCLGAGAGAVSCLGLSSLGNVSVLSSDSGGISAGECFGFLLNSPMSFSTHEGFTIGHRCSLPYPGRAPRGRLPCRTTSSRRTTSSAASCTTPMHTSWSRPPGCAITPTRRSVTASRRSTSAVATS